MVAVDHILGIDAFLLGTHRYGSAVAVAAGNHQNLIALQAVVTGKDISRQVASCHMAQVQRAVGIGPGHADEDTFSQGESSCRNLPPENPAGNPGDKLRDRLRINRETDYVVRQLIIT